jgi:SCF-associated factor 1
LTAKGSLHTVGVLDGQRIFATTERLKPLGFPPGYPSSSAEAQYDEPAIAIRQFSAGRSHILALSDSGRIWSWYDVKSPALHVKFASIDMKEISLTDGLSKSSTYGRVRQVVAGWSRSSAYIHGLGIVVWDPVERDDGEESTDAMLVLENAEVPRTRYQRIKDTRGESADDKALGEEVGVVVNYIILEHYVVFATDLGKIFCGRFGEMNKVDDILELRALRNETGTTLDVQGSFRRFAVFKNNEVITSDQSYLDACWNEKGNNPEQIDIAGLNRIPALQNNDVISVAFGDYHYLALHSNGKITSYGTELQRCGALGLGGEAEDEGKARGIAYERFGHDGRLLPHTYTNGRQVWFENSKKEWLRNIVNGGKDPEEARERIELFRTSQDVQGEVSEWLEQESRALDSEDTGDDKLGAYFVLRISAAGWHSGALVLVNDDLANRESPKSVEDNSFPRLRLANGTEMPGTKEFDEWREGRPEWDLGVQA